MATTESLAMVQEFYIAYYGRPADPDGLTYWADRFDASDDLTEVLAAFGESAEFTDNFGSLTATELVNNLYQQMFGRDAEAEGLTFYTELLESEIATLASIAKMIVDGASGDDVTILANKVTVAQTYTDAVTSMDSTYESDDIADAQAILDAVDETDASVTAGNAAAEAEVASNIAVGETFVLTNGSDAATANVFIADMVYTPDGSDRILSLQDEDDLTGTAGRTDNTLNVEMGNRNADEGTTAVVTPVLENIQIINVDWTGNTNTLDLRYADSVNTLNINKITQDANAVLMNNITTLASDLKVQDVYDNTSTQAFTYVRGVLDGADDTMSLELNNVLTQTLTVNSGGGANEGFENVALTVSNGVDIQGLFSVEDMENLTVTGTGFLDILSQVWTANEYNVFTAALANPGSIGQRTIDLSGFAGDSNIDITLNLGRNVDPGSSGAPYYGVTTGGAGDDTFHTNVAVAALATDSVQNVIDGGLGDNTLVSYAGGIVGVAGAAGDAVNVADINNIQHLELREQGAIGTVDLDAFDAELVSIFMRDEDAGVSTFTLNDLSADQAATGLTLAHGISTAGAPVVVANVKDATGAADTVGLTVVNDLNTGTTFDYTLAAAGADTDGIAANVNTGVAATSDADAIENITLHDNDTESNIVTLTNIINHDGTITLDGGVAGQTYTILGTLNSAIVDASAQASNLRLTVGDTVGAITTITQDVLLGLGDDVLTFANINELDATDSLIDAGGDDTVRAAFSTNSTLDIAGIENLHVTATANVTLNMAAADVTNLVLLGNNAVGPQVGADVDNNGVANINVAGASLQANIITLDSSALTELNFFSDADTDNASTVSADELVAHTFNGVTLSNNTATNLTANINTSLDLNDTGAAAGAASYGIGQITTHGNTGMDIIIGNERAAAGTTTTINNIYAKTMATLTATATGNLTLGTVSGAPLNNSLTTFDMSGVAGVVNANIISLGDNAVVTLASANNVVSALGSAGKDVVMTAGNGNNTLTGTAQDDTITTGSGRDIIAADRGDNVIASGAGNDTVTSKDGSDTVDLGTGIDVYNDNALTGIDAALANNTVSMSGGIATINIDVDGAAAGTVVDQMLAVGTGSDLTVSWVGNVMSTTTATLNGTVMSAADLAASNAVGAAAIAGTAASDLQVFTGAASFTAPPAVVGTATGVKTFNGGAGDDVVMWTGSAALDGLSFTGGAGNDAAIGTIAQDLFNGGTGADKYAMADIAAGDGVTDEVVIADGDSLASGYDQIFNFDANTAATVYPVVALGGAVAGADVLNLDAVSITAYASPALTTNITVGAVVVNGFNITATGLFTFDDTTVGAAVTAIGTGAAQVSLAEALATLAVELNGTTDTAIFAYDVTGDGVTADDSLFVFQDGASDTVVELIGVTGITGIETGAATINTLNII